MVLAQMLAPGFGHEGLEIATRVLDITEEAPHNRAIPATDGFKGAHRVVELRSAQGINPILYGDQHRPLLGRNLLIKLWHLPVQPGLRIEALGAAERKPERCRYIEEQKQSCQVEHVPSSRVGCHITPSNAAKRESALQHEQVRAPAPRMEARVAPRC